MYYVYILYNKELNRMYKGSCEDLKERMKDHAYHRVRTTKTAGEWKLVYYQAFVNKTDALREEKFLKTGKGRERLKYLLKTYIENIRRGA